MIFLFVSSSRVSLFVFLSSVCVGLSRGVIFFLFLVGGVLASACRGTVVSRFVYGPPISAILVEVCLSFWTRVLLLGIP